MDGAQTLTADAPLPSCTLDGLPMGVLAAILQNLPLTDWLRTASATCHATQAAVQQYCLPTLDTLDLTGMSGPATAGALSWLVACPHLRHVTRLVVQGAGCGEACRVLSEGQAGQRRLGGLRELSIEDWKQLDDTRLLQLIVHCNGLVSLSFGNCKVEDRGLLSVAVQCPHLQHISVKDCMGVTNTGVVELARRCTQLQEVVLDGCIHVTAEGVALLLHYRPALRLLSVERCYKLRDPVLTAVAAAADKTAGCAAPADQAPAGPAGSFPAAARQGSGTETEAGPFMRTLRIRQCPRLVSVGVLAACRGLRVLDMTGCAAVPGRELLRCLAGGVGPSLEQLALNGCRGVTGEDLQALCALCPRLEVLRCRGLDAWDHHLAAMAPRTGGLKLLDLTWCTKVTDRGIEHVVAANPGLEELQLEAIYNVTDHLLVLLERYAARLRRLNLRMCHCLSADALVQYASSARALTDIFLSGLMGVVETSELVRRLRAHRPELHLHW